MKCKFCENETEPGSTVCEECCRDAAETTEWIDKRPAREMKTTAKPAGPVEFEKHRRVVEEIDEPFRTICDLTDSEFPVDVEDQHGEFIADAFNVHHETGLSPREILAQRDELLKEMKRYLPILEDLEGYPSLWDSFAKGIGLATANGYRAAIQNASKGGEKG